MRNWKKGSEKLADHAKSVDHRTASSRKASVNSFMPVAARLDAHLAVQHRLRRQGLLSHLHTLKTLLRQGVAIRGDTDLESNIHQFNLDKSFHNDDLKVLMNDGRYVDSHDVLQEQEQLLVLEARRSILREIQKKPFYAILGDESTDVTKLEQFYFSVRSCNDNYEVKEDFIGIYECNTGVSSDALVENVKDILLRCNLDPSKVAGIGFDGASTMKCVAEKLKVVCGEQAYTSIAWLTATSLS